MKSKILLFIIIIAISLKLNIFSMNNNNNRSNILKFIEEAHITDEEELYFILFYKFLFFKKFAFKIFEVNSDEPSADMLLAKYTKIFSLKNIISDIAIIQINNPRSRTRRVFLNIAKKIEKQIKNIATKIDEQLTPKDPLGETYANNTKLVENRFNIVGF